MRLCNEVTKMHIRGIKIRNAVLPIIDSQVLIAELVMVFRDVKGLGKGAKQILRSLPNPTQIQAVSPGICTGNVHCQNELI